MRLRPAFAHRARAAALVGVVALVGAGACGGDGGTSSEDGAGGSTLSTASTAVTPTSALGTTTSSVVPVESSGCAGEQIEPGASAGTQAKADADGDGRVDDVFVFRTADDGWRLRVEFDAGGSGEAVLEGEGLGAGGATALPGADVDGDGIDELFVRIDGGDGTSQVGIFTVNNCTLEPATYQGAPVVFAVGVAGASIYGAQCGTASSGHGGALFLAEGLQGEGDRFDVATREYVLAAGELVLVGEPVETQASFGDEGYAAASTFACGDGAIVG